MQYHRLQGQFVLGTEQKYMIRTIPMIVLLIGTVSLMAACGLAYSAGKATAEKLTNEKRWVVQQGGATAALFDCEPDRLVFLESPSGARSEILAIDASNPQFADYTKLKAGDVVSFERTANPVQQACPSGAFVILKKVQ